MRLGVVINPTAGGNKGQVVGSRVLELLAKSNHEVVNLSGSSLAVARSNVERAISLSDIEALIVVGGDGMAHLAANVATGKDITVAIIPAGTGNDSAGLIGMPMDETDKSVEIILESLDKPKLLDALSIRHSEGETFAFGTASAGFDALVNARANRMTWPKGANRYYLAMLLELASFKPVKYKLEVDGERSEREAMLCVVSNSGVFGGGMLVVPDASVTDGLLDLLVLKKMSRTKLVRIFPRVYKGTHVTDPAVEITRANQVSIEASGMPIYSDGEYVGMAPFVAKVLPRALKVVAPKL